VRHAYLTIGLLLLATTAQARPPYLEAFAKLYKVDAEKPETAEQQDLRVRLSAVRCNACHVPNRPKTSRNEYGETLEGLLPAYDDNAFRDPKRSGGAYQEVYKALKAAEAEAGTHRYRYGDLIKNGYLPMYDK
jgi:cytochrome c553